MDGNFDYIIVGSGSSGSVLANRLSENPKNRVLVLEAGGTDQRFFVQMPLGYGKLFYDPAVNWMYKAEPDPGLNGASDHWPRGKILGGSSSINAMVYIRGHHTDYDDWAALGNTGWGWDEVLSAYRAMEDNEAGSNSYRGQGGPLFITSGGRDTHPLVQPYLAACAAAGLPGTDDFNGETQEGAGLYQFTIKGRRRNSAARAFLRPAMKRGNLAVLTGAHVTRILFQGRQAIGVEYRKNNQLHQALAANTILSGGAINTPQLLQLSGIGDGAALQALGLQTLYHNANVGAHLNDHQGLNYTYRMTVPTYNDILRPWWGKLAVGLQWALAGRGPLAKSINHAGGFFRTDPMLSRPNMQLYMQAFSTLLLRNGERPILTPDPFSGLSIGLSNCRPTSRGEITLKSGNPFEHPRITVNAFSTNHDVSEMLDAVKMVRRIAGANPLKSLIVEELRPGPVVHSDEDLIADFRSRAGTVYHPSCTARMGPDPVSSVIDPALRVHGIQNLRVCDASAFPTLPGGNTNAPAMMLGWRGADIINSIQ